MTLAVTLLRHATLVVEIGDRRVLVDPMLDPAAAREAVAGTPSARRNPLVELPAGWEAALDGIDAILVTHLHEDHLDATAVERLASLGHPVLCQPEDAATLEARGFADVRPVATTATLGGVELTRTSGRHGIDPDLVEALAPVSGFVLAAGDRRLYVVGDSVWCPEVAAALEQQRPDVVVANAGGARFLEGSRITMDSWDVGMLARRAPDATLVCVHLEAINHCLLTRDRLRWELEQAGVSALCPEDGARLEL